MRTIIAGSRGITDHHVLHDAIDHFHTTHGPITEVISGTARGVDRMGEEWAIAHRIPVTQYPAQWDQHGKAAGYIRNQEMVKNADALIAIWDGESRGTKHMIDIARWAGLTVLVWRKK